MPADLWTLYSAMLYSRLFEIEVSRLWERGLISGEMHLGTGEEAIVAGIVTQLREGDALALDHRPTSALLMRGVNPIALLREFLGREDGLCRGRGGHMHLFAPERLAASTGIVGATGPMAAGFALAAQHLRPGCVAIAFFGEGAMNEGSALEALNLAVAWSLPAVFVCKDNAWSITTHLPSVTGGSLADRARAFGLHTLETDGTDVLAVHQAADACLRRAREAAGPSFLLARCVHLDGHFLGDTMLLAARSPLRVLAPMAAPLLRSLLRVRGASPQARMGALFDILSRPRRAAASLQPGSDPLARARAMLQVDPPRLHDLESRIASEVQAQVAVALEPVTEGPPS